MTPTRPALRYYGGKWRLAPWILSFFPQHKNYIEPCAGAGSVLLQKARSSLETYNDIDGNVVNFFRVLRDRPDDLLRQIRLTPWARAEYESCWDDCDDALEQARRFWVWAWMGIGGQWGGWRSITTVESASAAWPSDNINIDHLTVVADRLQGVQIENLDYLRCMRKYDGPDTLIYLDPPYVQETRDRRNRYRFEWETDDHEACARAAMACAGYVVISGYACNLYRDLYEDQGWTRYDRRARTNGRHRTESVWISPRTANALTAYQQGELL